MKTKKELYHERLKRYVTACYNEQPDRIPVRVFSEELSSKYAGYSNFEAAVNHELQFEVNRKFAVDHRCDAIQTNSIVNWVGMMKSIGWKLAKFPGIELPVNSCTQWTEPSTEEEAFSIIRGKGNVTNTGMRTMLIKLKDPVICTNPKCGREIPFRPRKLGIQHKKVCPHCGTMNKFKR